jgi:hypothetical protein
MHSEFIIYFGRNKKNPIEIENLLISVYLVHERICLSFVIIIKIKKYWNITEVD